MNDKETYVLVTTAHGGVFVGYGPSAMDADNRIALREARMVVYYPRETHGVLGLATRGPMEGARIGPAAPNVTLTGVTLVAPVSEAARKGFEDEPWN